MWIVLGGIATFVGAAILKLMDVLIEGRGAWARRSISADIELLAKLPDDVRTSPAAGALIGRIEQSLLAFSGGDEPQFESIPDVGPATPSSSREARPDTLRARYRREVDRMEVRVALAVIGILVVAAAVWLTWVSPFDTDEGIDFGGTALWGLGLGAALAVPTLVVSRLIAVRIVRRKWKRQGLPIPTISRL